MAQKQEQRQKRKKKAKMYTGILTLMWILRAGSVSNAQEEVTLNVMIRYDFQIPEDCNLIFEKADQMVWEKIGVHLRFIPVLPMTQTEERIMAEKEGIIIDIASKITGEFEYQEMDELLEQFPDIQIVFIESGGDNLSATFSPELADATIFVIDVAEGDKIPRKGGPGITRSDLLIINKIDLAEMVGASLEIMDRDSRRMRGNRPFLFTNIRGDSGVDRVVEWIKKSVLFEENV